VTRFIAFLRAINVGGRTSRMDQLRQLFESMGFSNVETFIASGNVVFHARSTSPSALERRIAASLERQLGYDVSTFIRTEAELDAIARFEPFPRPDLDKAASLNVGFVAKPFDRAATSKLMAFSSAIDDFAARGREVYWLCRTRQSESTFSNVVFEKALGMRITFRGANTVRRMADRYVTSRAAARSSR
jgi:uncharacterized protein (DUF1697 family)